LASLGSLLGLFHNVLSGFERRRRSRDGLLSHDQLFYNLFLLFHDYLFHFDLFCHIFDHLLILHFFPHHCLLHHLCPRFQHRRSKPLFLILPYRLHHRSILVFFMHVAFPRHWLLDHFFAVFTDFHGAARLLVLAFPVVGLLAAFGPPSQAGRGATLAVNVFYRIGGGYGRIPRICALLNKVRGSVCIGENTPAVLVALTHMAA